MCSVLINSKKNCEMNQMKDTLLNTNSNNIKYKSILFNAFNLHYYLIEWKIHQ
jgi:hypothetical protein